MRLDLRALMMDKASNPNKGKYDCDGFPVQKANGFEARPTIFSRMGVYNLGIVKIEMLTHVN